MQKATSYNITCCQMQSIDVEINPQPERAHRKFKTYPSFFNEWFGRIDSEFLSISTKPFISAVLNHLLELTTGPVALGQNQRPDNVKVLITSRTFYSGSFIMTRSSGSNVHSIVLL